jgi:hypothetical protein
MAASRRVWLLIAAIGLAMGAGMCATQVGFHEAHGCIQVLFPSKDPKRALSDADRAMARKSFESMVDPADKLNVDTAHAYLRVWSYLLLATGVGFVGLAVIRGVSGKSTSVRQRGVQGPFLWMGLALAAWIFSYCVSSLPPAHGYVGTVLGPAWITGPIFLTAVLALPLAALVLGSIFEKTDDRIVTKLNALVLMYVYGALWVDWETPGYLFSDPDLERFDYVGPGYHALGVAASFLVASLVMRYAKKVPSRPNGDFEPRGD